MCDSPHRMSDRREQILRKANGTLNVNRASHSLPFQIANSVAFEVWPLDSVVTTVLRESRKKD